MLFHTWEFGAFLFVITLGLLVIVAARKLLSWRMTSIWLLWLLAGSYWFYGSWNVYYLALIVYSTAVDYLCVLAMEYELRVPGRKWNLRRFWLVVSLVNNLGLLGFYKYSDFLVGNINQWLDFAGSSHVLPSMSTLMPAGWSMVLPVGISFYTFQSLSYTIDYYRGEIPAERNFVRFATFVAFFPQLVAGPIERSSRLLPQFYDLPRVTLQHITDGASLFLVGLFKKVALANYAALYVERVYANPERCDAATLTMGTFCFAWQIYFDFSGYSDMARGIARGLGFDLMLNFRNPYTATGLSDFWARWHISLSTWFRDYLYIPLGGSRQGSWRTYRNLLVVFVVSGLWHGAGWNFVVWGALHAVGVMVTRALERSAWYRHHVPKLLKQAAVFLLVCFAWIFFRSSSLEQASAIVTGIATRPWGNPNCPLLLLALIGAVWLYQLLYESRYRRFLETAWVQAILALAMLVYLVLCSAEGGEFIYFQF